MRRRLLAAVMVLLPPTAMAQSGIPYLVQVPASVRAAGLNGGSAALVGDAGSVFDNPANLATVRHLALEGAYQAIGDGAYVGTAALAWRLGQFHVGFGGRYFDFGADPASYVAPVPPGTTIASEMLGVGSLVYRFGLIAVGGSGKYSRLRVGDVMTEGASIDAGLTIAIFDLAAFAFSVQNIGGNLMDTSSAVFPRMSRFGFTMNYVDPQESFRLLSTVEVQWLAGAKSRGVIGLEAGAVISGVGIIARAAYAGRPAPLSNTKVTVGGTLTLGRLQLDYAYRPDDVDGGVAHLAGLRLTL